MVDWLEKNDPIKRAQRADKRAREKMPLQESAEKQSGDHHIFEETMEREIPRENADKLAMCPDPSVIINHLLPDEPVGSQNIAPPHLFEEITGMDSPQMEGVPMTHTEPVDAKDLTEPCLFEDTTEENGAEKDHQKSRSRHIPSPLRHQVLLRDKGQCCVGKR